MSSPSTHPSVKSDTVLMATYYQKANNLYHPHHASYGGATGAELQPATFHHQISPYGLDATTTSYSHTYQTHPVVHHTQSHYSPTLQNQMNWPQIAAHRYGQMAGPANMAAHLADYNNNRLFNHGSNSVLPASAEMNNTNNPNTNPHRNIRQSINPVTTYPEWLTAPTTGNGHQQAIAITSTSGLRTVDSTPNNNDTRLIDVNSSSMQTTLVSQQDHQVLPASQKNPNGIRVNHSLHTHRYPSPVFHRTCMDQSPPPPPNPHGDYLPPTPSGTDLHSNSLSNSPAESFSDISLSTSDLVQALPQQPSIHPSLQHHPSLLHNTCHPLNRLNSPIVSAPSNGAYLHLPHHLALDRSGSNDEGLCCSSDPDSSSPNPSMNGCRAPYDWMRSAQMDNTSKIRKAGRTRTKDKYRVVYSDYQRLELEKEFHCSFYINVIRKAELAQELGLSQRQIKIWFQNRRAKDRKLRQREMDKGHIKCETGLNDSSLSAECLSPSTNSPHRLSGEENSITS